MFSFADLFKADLKPEEVVGPTLPTDNVNPISEVINEINTTSIKNFILLRKWYFCMIRIGKTNNPVK